MPRKKKEVEVIDMGGAKTVARKKSFVTRTKTIFWIFSIVWIALVVASPLYVKNTYSQPIKKSIVVSMFFDLQRNVVEQYEKLLDGIKDAIDLEKPIALAIDQVKMVESGVEKVTDTTAEAKKATDEAQKATGDVKKLAGLAGKFGIDTSGINKVVGEVDKGISDTNKAIAKVDDTAKLVNEKLDSIEKNLAKVAQTEIDKMIDEAIKAQLDKETGGLGTTLLTNYGIQHVYPWRPSSWGVATKIYNDLSKSNVDTITALTGTVDTYFDYVAWGLVIAAWAIGLLLWIMVFKKVKMALSPFIVCPRCGNTFADKRTAYSLLKVLQPWKWL